MRPTLTPWLARELAMTIVGVHSCGHSEMMCSWLRATPCPPDQFPDSTLQASCEGSCSWVWHIPVGDAQLGFESHDVGNITSILCRPWKHVTLITAAFRFTIIKPLYVHVMIIILHGIIFRTVHTVTLFGFIFSAFRFILLTVLNQFSWKKRCCWSVYSTILDPYSNCITAGNFSIQI